MINRKCDRLPGPEILRLVDRLYRCRHRPVQGTFFRRGRRTRRNRGNAASQTLYDATVFPAISTSDEVLIGVRVRCLRFVLSGKFA